MKINMLPIGLYMENTYVLHENGHVLVIDPGCYNDILLEAIGDDVVDGIILTHGHEDHTLAVDDLYDKYHCPIYMHMDDYYLCDPKAKHYSYDAPIYAPITQLPESFQLGIFDLKTYHTPGHTPGSCCIQYRNVLFTGDTLFASSIGRTDLPGGDEWQMKQSLKLFATLPHDLKVLPGHDHATTIKQELMMNPYLRQVL